MKENTSVPLKYMYQRPYFLKRERDKRTFL